MSLTSTMWIGLSGLSASSDSINVTSDNIANLNTVGHRASRAQFKDMLSRSMVGVGQMGGGVTLGRIEKLFHQGAIVGSPRNTDMAISGRGMFIVAGNHNGRDGNFYTRAGQFSMSDQGYLVNADGLRVQGYSATRPGTVGSSLSDIFVDRANLPPQATTTARLIMSLDSTLAAGQGPQPVSMQIIDSLGAPHTVEVNFTKTNNPAGNEWSWTATVDGADVAGGTPGTPVQISPAAGGAPNLLTFDTSGTAVSGTSASLNFNFGSGAAAQPVTLDFGNTAQHALGGAGGTTIDLDIDGYSAGSFIDMSVQPDGNVIGHYSNGQSITIARLGLADFRNPEGLERLGSTLFSMTPESGDPLVGAPKAGGRGEIRGGALEQSNVDLSTEFVRLITDQRAYQATSRTITTADELMAETVNLKR